MGDIQRWEHAGMQSASWGEWVLVTDHERVVAEAVEAERERIKSEIEREFSKTRIGNAPTHLNSYLAGVNSYRKIVLDVLATGEGKD